MNAPTLPPSIAHHGALPALRDSLRPRTTPQPPGARRLACLVGSALALAIGGCSSEPAAACPQGQQCRPIDEAEGAAPNPEVTPSSSKGDASVAEPPQKQGLRYQDAKDGGNDPWVAGCHYEYSDAACQTSTGRVYGDECISQLDLREWTNRACHLALPYDEVIHYCDYECKTQKNAVWGICVTEEIDCNGTKVTSARCECLDEVPTGTTPRGATDLGPRIPTLQPSIPLRPILDPRAVLGGGTGGEADTEGDTEGPSTAPLRLDPTIRLRQIDTTRLQPANPDAGGSSSGG